MVTIAPLTTKSHPFPTRIKIKHQNKNGWIILDQIRTVDKQRIVKSYQKLAIVEITQIKSVIKETFVD